MTSLLIAAILASGAAGGAAEKRDTFVVVDGSRYRVTVKGDLVTVNKKAMVVKYTIAERDAQREAVRIATGCEVIDELPGSARLHGKLFCNPSR